MKSEFERWLDKDQELQLQQILATTGCLRAHIENKSYPDGKDPAKALTSDPMHATFFKESLKMKKTGRQDSVPYADLLLASIPTPSSVSSS